MIKHILLMIVILNLSLVAIAQSNDYLSFEDCNKLIRNEVEEALKEKDNGQNMGIGMMAGGSTLAAAGVTSSAGVGGAFLPFGSTFITQGSSLYSMSGNVTFLEYQLLVVNAANEASAFVAGPFTKSLAFQLNKATYMPENENQLELALEYRELLNQKSIKPELLSSSILSVIGTSCKGNKVFKYVTPELLIKAYVENNN